MFLLPHHKKDYNCWLYLCLNLDTMMFIGYANNHDGDCYRMFNPKTDDVSKTRDMIWLRQIFMRNKIPKPPRRNQ